MSNLFDEEVKMDEKKVSIDTFPHFLSEFVSKTEMILEVKLEQAHQNDEKSQKIPNVFQILKNLSRQQWKHPKARN